MQLRLRRANRVLIRKHTSVELIVYFSLSLFFRLRKISYLQLSANYSRTPQKVIFLPPFSILLLPYPQPTNVITAVPPTRPNIGDDDVILYQQL